MKKIFAHNFFLMLVLISAADSFAAERRERSCTKRAVCFVLGFLGITYAQRMALSVPMRSHDSPVFVMTEDYQAMLDRVDEDILAYRCQGMPQPCPLKKRTFDELMEEIKQDIAQTKLRKQAELELRKKKEAHERIPKLLKLKKRKGDL